MLNSQEIEAILRKTGVYKQGHFKFTSGLHSDTYLEKFQLLQYPKVTELLCQELARRTSRLKPDVVVGPATGGIILAYELARQLGCRSIFTEREEGAMALRRGFSVALEERVLLVEDIVTTGGSVREVLACLAQHQAQVVGVAALVDRSGGRVTFPVEFYPLLQLHMAAWEAETCPLCRRGLPLVEPGSRNLKK